MEKKKESVPTSIYARLLPLLQPYVLEKNQEHHKEPAREAHHEFIRTFIRTVVFLIMSGEY